MSHPSNPTLSFLSDPQTDLDAAVYSAQMGGSWAYENPFIPGQPVALANDSLSQGQGLGMGMLGTVDVMAMTMGMQSTAVGAGLSAQEGSELGQSAPTDPPPFQSHPISTPYAPDFTTPRFIDPTTLQTPGVGQRDSDTVLGPMTAAPWELQDSNFAPSDINVSHMSSIPMASIYTGPRYDQLLQAKFGPPSVNNTVPTLTSSPLPPSATTSNSSMHLTIDPRSGYPQGSYGSAPNSTTSASWLRPSLTPTSSTPLSPSCNNSSMEITMGSSYISNLSTGPYSVSAPTSKATSPAPSGASILMQHKQQQQHQATMLFQSTSPVSPIQFPQQLPPTQLPTLLAPAFHPYPRSDPSSATFSLNTPTPSAPTPLPPTTLVPGQSQGFQRASSNPSIHSQEMRTWSSFPGRLDAEAGSSSYPPPSRLSPLSASVPPGRSSPLPQQTWIRRSEGSTMPYYRSPPAHHYQLSAEPQLLSAPPQSYTQSQSYPYPQQYESGTSSTSGSYPYPTTKGSPPTRYSMWSTVAKANNAESSATSTSVTHLPPDSESPASTLLALDSNSNSGSRPPPRGLMDGSNESIPKRKKRKISPKAEPAPPAVKNMDDSVKKEVTTQVVKKPSSRRRNKEPVLEIEEPPKVVIACYNCRAKKLKCDGARPRCHNCTRRDEEGCSYDAALKRRGPGKKTKERLSQCDSEAHSGRSRDAGMSHSGRGGGFDSRFGVSTERG